MSSFEMTTFSGDAAGFTSSPPSSGQEFQPPPSTKPSEQCSSKMASTDIYSAPVCMIETAEDGQLRLNPEVIKQVQRIKHPVVVVAIAGLYRTGKSYLLSKLSATPSTGFSMGSTIESHTKGIWIWARPHPSHDNQVLLLLDTEGLGDAHKGNKNHDNWIFCLATLLSSVLCYNAKGNIDDNSLSHLNFIAELAKHLRQTTNEEEDVEQYFPHFIYILRDFHCELTRGGKKLTPDEHLEECLVLKKEESKQDENYNLPRRCIRKNFRSRRCFTFTFPVLCPDKMKHLDDVPDSDLAAAFVEQTELFCSYIFQNAPVKTMENGQVINGRMWSSLMTSYVDALNDGKIPSMENAVVAMAFMENTQLVETCMTEYRKLMGDAIVSPPPSEKELHHKHISTQRDIVSIFKSKAIFDYHKFEEKLYAEINTVFEEIRDMNEKAQIRFCEGVLNELEATVIMNLASGEYTRIGGFEAHGNDIKEIQENYEARKDLGEKKNDVLLKFLAEKEREGNGILLAERKLIEAQKKYQEEHDKAADTMKKLEDAELSLNKAQQQALEERMKHDKLIGKQLKRKDQGCCVIA